MATMQIRLDLLTGESKALKAHIKTIKTKKGKTKTIKIGDKELTLSDDKGVCERRIAKLGELINTHQMKMSLKDDSKTVALGTSKINYMDPRITVAWCKRKDVPIEKIFSTSLLNKFPWAMEVDAEWAF
jgi:DNA topoisomerase-1